MRTAGIWLLGLLMAVTIVMAFAYAPEATRPNYAVRDAAGNPTLVPWPQFRIFFFHVPAAWVAVLAFTVAMVASLRVLRGTAVRRLDDLAAASSEVGLLFSVLALGSGMIWARAEWGAFWSWDPRQNTLLILLLIYAGYFALRSAVLDPERRSRLAAVYSIVAFVTVPFLVFVIPRIMETLHPSPIIQAGQRSGTMDAKMRLVFFLFLFGYTGLYVWMLSVKRRVLRLTRKVEAL